MKLILSIFLLFSLFSMTVMTMAVDTFATLECNEGSVARQCEAAIRTELTYLDPLEYASGLFTGSLSTSVETCAEIEAKFSASASCKSRCKITDCSEYN